MPFESYKAPKNFGEPIIVPDTLSILTMAIKYLQSRNILSDLYTVFLFTRSDIRICLIPVVSTVRQ